MVVHELSETEIDRIFQALADATRRDIVSRVLTTERSVTALAEHYDMSFAAVQKHVQVLERARLVTKVRNGRQQLVHSRLDTIAKATTLLQAYEEIWKRRARRIDDILADDTFREQS